MVKFKAKVWKIGGSRVLTIPSRLLGREFEPGKNVIVEVLDAARGIMSPNTIFSFKHAGEV